ncbi:hypothetical protein V496_01047 [Pseudogymnoascus sp. VKM F-4515 (FW-2607)]|nr:hypothetical protein V496_01047 [Pseudogymnoascus sp. VKM F-4515 (FW-2607)]KFY95936.1 hypothetical protein V498_03014 [Pseudogymnoascus sp. VKM F-4517 (FW-2822)]
MYHFGSMAQVPQAGKPVTTSKLARMEVLQQDSLLAPPRRRVFRGLRRVRPVLDLHGDVDVQPGSSAATIQIEKKRGKTEPLLRLWIRSPWEDYQAIKLSNGLTVAGRKSSYFKMATVTSFAYLGAINALECLLAIRHPNVAPVHDLYHCDNMLHIVGEYLELSVTQLDFQCFQLEEWEIATIMTQVLDGILYLLSKGVDCGDLSMLNIRLSSQGDIKIGMFTGP